MATDAAPETTSPAKRPIEDEPAYVKALLEGIVEAFPARRATSQQERKAQEHIQKKFDAVGLETHEETFRFNDNLYANLALHFGVAVAGTAALPQWAWLGLSLHLLAFVSYFLDSTHKFYILRRLFPWAESRNVLGVLPAKDTCRLRFVLPAHIDAAFTGWIFHPKLVKSSAKPLLGIQFLRKQLAQVMLCLLLLICLDVVFLATGWFVPWLVWALTIPALLATLLNLQVVIRGETVPGANDDLSGVVALPVLASRLAAWKPDDVELVFVSTGAEETSLGGADAMARKHLADWDKQTTVVLALDGFSNGTLRYFQEGELLVQPLSPRLEKELQDTIASDDRFQGIARFQIPVGGSDALAFSGRGYEATCLGCVDEELGAPRHYHLPEDVPENIDYDCIMHCIDFTEALIHHIADKRLAPKS